MKVQRFEAVDALRGAAMVWMTLFHLCFDLNQFGYIGQNFYVDPVWTWQRACIISVFLFCAGLGQAISVAQGQSWGRFWRRWRWMAVCALLITAASWFIYPRSFIYFGVLHGMAVMLIVARLTAGWGFWLWGLGSVVIASKFIATYALGRWATGHFVELLNAPVLNWIGWITEKPITEDYVPMAPWLGVMWFGVAAGNVLMRSSAMVAAKWMPSPLRPLATLGRWSLPYYMLHQPILWATFMCLAFFK